MESEYSFDEDRIFSRTVPNRGHGIVYRLGLHLLSLALGTGLSFAQSGSLAPKGPENAGVPYSQMGTTELVVELAYADGRRGEEAIQVYLESSGQGSAGERFTDTQGRVIFQNVRSGLYTIKVRGTNIKPLTTEAFNIAGFERSHREYVRIEREDDAYGGLGAPAGIVSEAELKIPKTALKEFKMGNDEVSKGNKDAAIEHYRTAAKLYPQYAMAHNNLAALYIQSKDFARADEELKKALEADPNLSWTIANIIKLKIVEQKYVDAVPLIARALAKEPNNSEFLYLMSKTQFLLKNYDQSLIYARRVYSASHQGFELAHIIAGRSLELQDRPDEAKVEYEKLLSESPSAPEAAEARKSLARLDQARPRKQ
jgi:tetratricopeptide (TPR) repeat protein